jgi:hypothetical protein
MAMPMHPSLLTLDEFVALPEDDSARYELRVLTVAPRPRPWHRDLMSGSGCRSTRSFRPVCMYSSTSTS